MGIRSGFLRRERSHTQKKTPHPNSLKLAIRASKKSAVGIKCAGERDPARLRSEALSTVVTSAL
jgi:hypothetical protein